MRYLLQIGISRLVKNHPRKVPFVLVKESSGKLFVQDKEGAKKKYRQPNSKIKKLVLVKGTWLKGKQGLQKTTEKERGNKCENGRAEKSHKVVQKG